MSHEKNLNFVSEQELKEIAEAFGEDSTELMNQDLRGELTVVREIKKVSIPKTMLVSASKEAVRVATDNFMSIQKRRIGLQNQIRSISQGFDTGTDETEGILNMFLADAVRAEKNAEAVLISITKHNPICQWMLANVGIGPILAAELYAYLDFSKAKYASGFISYAGLNNNNRPRLSTTDAQKIVDTVIGDATEITDEMLMEIATASKWPIEYLRRKISTGPNITALVKKYRLIKTIELMLDDEDIDVDAANVSATVNNFVCQPSATKEDLQRLAEHYNLPYDKLYDLSVPKATKKKTSGGTVRNAKETIRAAISVLPYNKKLRMIVYKLSVSFLNQKNNPNCFYGKLYEQRYQYESQKNLNGDYAEQAAEILKKHRYSTNTSAYDEYSQGRLPKSHLVARSLRWAAKVFINHLWEAMYVYYTQSPETCPKHYAINQLGHRDIILPAVSYDMLMNKNLPDNQKNNHPIPPLT